MVTQLSTLPAGKDKDQLLNYYSKLYTQMSVSVVRYDMLFSSTLLYTALYVTVSDPTCIYIHTAKSMKM